MKANGNVTSRSRYLRMVSGVQDEVSRQYIHENLRPGEVRQRILAKPGGNVCDSTVKRFLRYGRGHSRMVYSMGPFATTVLAIAEALGYRIEITRSE
jgi:hypothetical protein